MPKRILVVDDDKAMLELYKRMLLKTDYLIFRASGFDKAAELIKKNKYDLLITDLMFPSGLGLRLVKLFEKKQAGAGSLIVTGAVSGLSPEKRPAVYLEKPFSYKVFMGAVASALEN